MGKRTKADKVSPAHHSFLSTAFTLLTTTDIASKMLADYAEQICFQNVWFQRNSYFGISLDKDTAGDLLQALGAEHESEHCR